MNIGDSSGPSQLLALFPPTWPHTHVHSRVTPSYSLNCVRATKLFSCGLESEDHWCYRETFDTMTTAPHL